MNSKIGLRLSLVFAPLIGSAIAANSVTYDFESSSADDLFSGGGVSGWSQDTANPSAFGKTFPLAYIAATNFSGGSSSSAHVGTQFANTPDNVDTTLTGDLSSLPHIYNMLTVSFDMAVLDDSADSFAGRDAFSVALTTAAGGQAATIGFSPTAASNDAWDVSVGVNGSTSTTPYTIDANSGYSFYINSRDNSTEFQFGAAGSGPSVTIATINAATSLNSVTGIAFGHDPLATAGTSAHTLAFDNVSVQIPEPSSSLLMVLSAGLIAIRRRR